MDPTWKNNCLTLAVLLLAIPMLLATTANAADVTVDCTSGPADFPSITDALNALDLQGPHTIFLAPGECVENVVIDNRVGKLLCPSFSVDTFPGPLK